MGFFEDDQLGCSLREVPRIAGTLLRCLSHSGPPVGHLRQLEAPRQGALGISLCLVAAEALLAASSLFVHRGLSLGLVTSASLMELRLEAGAG